jgi:hypothetical protein
VSLRFALRWTFVGLLCALALVAAGVVLSALRPPPPQAQPVTIDDLMAAAFMPLDSGGLGTQVISGTTFYFRLSPYPPRSMAPATVILVAIGPDGRTPTAVTPTLYVAQPGEEAAREYVMPRLADQSYAIRSAFFPRPGPWRLRLDVHVGGAEPVNMLIAVEAR